MILVRTIKDDRLSHCQTADGKKFASACLPTQLRPPPLCTGGGTLQLDKPARLRFVKLNQNSNSMPPSVMGIHNDAHRKFIDYEPHISVWHLSVQLGTSIHVKLK